MLWGPPGAGKGTQAKRWEATLKLRQLSTGDLVRAEIAAQTSLGKEIQKIVEQGDLPGDDLIISLMRQNLRQYGQGVIFDGFPRTLYQAVILDQLVTDGEVEAPCVVSLRVDENVLVSRIAGRVVCATCGAIYSDVNPSKKQGVCDACGGKELMTRKDDAPETVRHRFKVYKEKTEPLLAYYADKGSLVEVDGMQLPQEVERQLNQVLSREMDKKASILR